MSIQPSIQNLPYDGPHISMVSQRVCEKYYITMKTHEISGINGETSVAVLIALEQYTNGKFSSR